MKPMTLGAAIAAAILTVALAMPAEAAKRKRSYIYYGKDDRYYQTRTSTRITVRRRSFLDPGTETLPFDQTYADYAYPPGYRVYYDRTDSKGSWDRMPLPNPWDMPGWRKF